jgi:hypothetical protein
MFQDTKGAYETNTNSEMDNDMNGNIEEPVMKTLLHGLLDSHSIYDLQKNQINIAPAEVYMPLGIFQDSH